MKIIKNGKTFTDDACGYIEELMQRDDNDDEDEDDEDDEDNEISLSPKKPGRLGEKLR